tara:strand:- start:39180 stop:39395 length:216 start_codon:yes stop_codon:yes gene_type:complete
MLPRICASDSSSCSVIHVSTVSRNWASLPDAALREQCDELHDVGAAHDRLDCVERRIDAAVCGQIDVELLG